MDNAGRIKATLATFFIERSQALYLQTGNPIHVWRVYDLARHGRVPIPDWVFDYFDKVATVLIAPKGPSSPKAIANALGLGTKGGPSKTRQAETDQRNLDLVGHIVFLRDRAMNRDDVDLDLRDELGIMQRVADQYGLSLERVQAVYYELIRPRPRPPV